MAITAIVLSNPVKCPPHIATGSEVSSPQEAGTFDAGTLTTTMGERSWSSRLRRCAPSARELLEQLEIELDHRHVPLRAGAQVPLHENHLHLAAHHNVGTWMWTQ